MNLNDFIENLIDLFDDTDAELITAETRFKELEEWSSLLALSVIAMVNEEYDTELKGDDIRRSDTVQDLFNVVESKQR